MDKLRIRLFYCLLLASVIGALAVEKGQYGNVKMDGYKGIWFDLHQNTEYGPKYSGGLGTYTMKHTPMAIYSPEKDRTYFVYGGTTGEDERYLLCMIGCYDHKTGMVCKPTVVYDKQGVDDPHDDPSILIDKQGYVFVYVAGRSNKRVGYIYRSKRPYDISEFESVGFEELMAYPQPYLMEDGTHFLFFTRYDGVRRLYYRTSPNGKDWSTPYQSIANIIAPGDKKSGHYQITGKWGNKLVTTFNRHFNGDCDTRTNIYYMQTTDGGKTWTQADGKTVVHLPVTKVNDPCRILDAESKGQNVYIKHVNFDGQGNPLVLYLTSYGPFPGPAYGPREWFVAHWNGRNWMHHFVTTSTSNYDSGSIYVEGKLWRIIAPTAPGPEKWGIGGEVESWISTNQGKTWKKEHEYTKDSPRNHGYCRMPLHAKDPFYTFWADGNFYNPSISYLYFGDSKGNTYRLPYEMKSEWEKPQQVAKEVERYSMKNWKQLSSKKVKTPHK